MKNRVPRHNQKLRRLFLCNAEADGELLQRVAQPDAAGKGSLAQATQGMKLSVRASYHRMAARGAHSGGHGGCGAGHAPTYRRSTQLPPPRSGAVRYPAYDMDVGVK